MLQMPSLILRAAGTSGGASGHSVLTALALGRNALPTVGRLRDTLTEQWQRRAGMHENRQQRQRGGEPGQQDRRERGAGASRPRASQANREAGTQQGENAALHDQTPPATAYAFELLGRAHQRIAVQAIEDSHGHRSDNARPQSQTSAHADELLARADQRTASQAGAGSRGHGQWTAAQDAQDPDARGSRPALPYVPEPHEGDLP